MALTKNDRITIAVFILIFAGFLLFCPLFPFQRNPLFADAPTRYETYAVYVRGEYQNLADFQLQNPYDGDPTYTAGRKQPSIYKWGEILPLETLEHHLQSLTAVMRIADPVCLHREIYAQGPDGNLGMQQSQWLRFDQRLAVITDIQEIRICQEGR